MSAKSSAAVTGNRVSAHRAKYGRLDVSIPLSVESTIAQLAQENQVDKAQVVRMLLRYALTNRDWRSQGMDWRLMDL